MTRGTESQVLKLVIVGTAGYEVVILSSKKCDFKLSSITITVGTIFNTTNKNMLIYVIYNIKLANYRKVIYY